MKNKMLLIWIRFISIALSVLLLSSAEQLTAGEAGVITARYLRCEYKVNPLGIDSANPRLSWIVASDQRGRKQTAYQVLVASSSANLKKNLGDLWDSGKVRSDATAQIAYGASRWPGPGVLLESHGLGQQRPSLGLERTREMEHGAIKYERLAGAMDWLRHRPEFPDARSFSATFGHARFNTLGRSQGRQGISTVPVPAQIFCGG